MADPLRDTLFRSTAEDRPDAARPAAPAGGGTRIRAGNAMERSRAAILDGARRCVQQAGTAITMSQVAVSAGVAKATLYNHFRTREDVLRALLAYEVERLIADLAGARLPDALSRAASALSTSPLLRAAGADPATRCALAAVAPDAAGWTRARAAVEAALSAEHRAGTELVLRWLASFVVNPGEPAAIADDVALLMAALPDQNRALVPGAVRAG